MLGNNDVALGNVSLTKCDHFSEHSIRNNCISEHKWSWITRPCLHLILSWMGLPDAPLPASAVVSGLELKEDPIILFIFHPFSKINRILVPRGRGKKLLFPNIIKVKENLFCLVRTHGWPCLFLPSILNLFMQFPHKSPWTWICQFYIKCFKMLFIIYYPNFFLLSILTGRKISVIVSCQQNSC